MDETQQRLSDETFAALAERIESLPIEHVDWVVQIFLECRRAREAEAQYIAAGEQGAGGGDPTRIVLDTADWLRTLWEVGYMGSEALPAQPRSEFPQINVEDILKSALFARIRRGKRPLPFPPPTRDGMPWHEVVECDQPIAVRAEVTPHGQCIIEGCGSWLVQTAEPDGSHIVQHRGKGPLYRLALDGQGGGTLHMQPASLVRRIVRQERVGIVAWLLEWPQDNGAIAQVPLRAPSWERAEAEAQRWVALRHPDLYGQIRYERSEA
ncbi:MAG: hypothetical protein HZC22_19355 [Rhodocyclales bacterium]|nr:hypothetical protein [Rhodocyclales bacterium]